MPLAQNITNENTVPTHYLGSFTYLCWHCHAFHWLAEKRSCSSRDDPEYADCCSGGEVTIPYLDHLPTQFCHFLDGLDRRSREFRKNIRQYNKVFAFTSTGGSGHPVTFPAESRGPPIYKIQGEVHHQIRPLRKDKGSCPIFSQLFVYHHVEALNYRNLSNPERDSATMEDLQNVMESHNPLLCLYKQARELMDNTTLAEYRIQLDFRKCLDHRTYNLPGTSKELAVLILGDEEALANAQDIIVRPRGGPLVHISQCHPAFIALHFPLLCPTGQSSWTPNMSYASANDDATRHISLCDYTKFCLHP